MALTAYMMLRKSQAFGFNSWEEGPRGRGTLGLCGQQMMGPLIEPESRYNNKVYRNTVLSPPMLTTASSTVMAGCLQPLQEQAQRHDRSQSRSPGPWMDSSKAGLTARRCAQLGGYARA